MSTPAPQPGPELERLAPFLGKWKLEGQQHESLVGPAAKVTAEETYEWLPGGFFLVHHFDGRVGNDRAACIEITGYDASTETYPTRTFYNNGQVNDWQVREHDGVWTFTGNWPIGGQSMKVRCTVEFSDGSNARAAKWEYSGDRAKWTTFWEVKAKRL